jgi:hypothetical protein
MNARSTILLVLWFLCPPSLILSADTTVLLDSGRRVRGDIVVYDSVADVLTMRQQRPGATLVWRANWDRIRSATVDNVELSGKELRDRTRRDVTALVIDKTTASESAHTSTPAVRILPTIHKSPEELAGRLAAIPMAGPRLPQITDTALTSVAARWYDDGLCGRGIVVGLRDDPLSGYPDLEGRQFPYGVPLSERGYTRDLFRNARAIDVYGPPNFVGPVPLPALSSGRPATSSVITTPGRSDPFLMLDNGGNGRVSRLLPLIITPPGQPNPFLELTTP